MNLRDDERGVTLLEMLIVVIILAVLTAIIVPKLTGRTDSARRAAAMADIRSGIGMALDLYELDNGRYPTSEQGLQALLTRPTSPATPNWSGPYLKGSLPTDPWGNPYVYRYPGQRVQGGYDLFSKGADGAEGTADDVTNWNTENP